LVKKEVLGAATLSILVIVFILVNNYLPSVAKHFKFCGLLACVLVLLYSIIFLIRATLKSRRKK
jgi:uncharacterized membrane protein YhdT